MTRFIQIHALTSYPPSNLNRDDAGRPKTAIVGGTTRLRISSQSLKRAWRTSEVFSARVGEGIGIRSRRFGEEARKAFLDAGIAEKDARAWSDAISNALTKAADRKEKAPKAKGKGKTAAQGEDENSEDAGSSGKDVQLVHLSEEEHQRVMALVRDIIARKKAPDAAALAGILGGRPSVDVALFGRMLADLADHNVDAAVQVSHAFTVHPVTVEDDYFTAVDDLQPRGDTGAGHVNVHEFGSGTFYTYVCIDRQSLAANLGGNDVLAGRACAGLLEALATVSPSGKQNSFASRSYASYLLVEKGDRQPRMLSAAFIDGIREAPVMDSAIKALEAKLGAFDKAYGVLADERKKLNVESGEGSLDDLLKFVG